MWDSVKTCAISWIYVAIDSWVRLFPKVIFENGINIFYIDTVLV